MPRHLKPVPLEEIDYTNEDPAYWELILKREGLGMQRGLHPHIYVGTARDVEDLRDDAGTLTHVKQHHGTVVHNVDEDS